VTLLQTDSTPLGRPKSTQVDLLDPTRRSTWEGANVLFCDLEMAYFGEFRGAIFQVFIYYYWSAISEST